jgi:hypothetical protein
VRLLHSLARTSASFDDPDLVSHAGLIPVMALAQRAGPGDLIAGLVRPGGDCGVNAHLKVPCLVAGMAAGADSIDDMAAPRGALLYRPRSGRGLEEVSVGLMAYLDP